MGNTHAKPTSLPATPPQSNSNSHSVGIAVSPSPSTSPLRSIALLPPEILAQILHLVLVNETVLERQRTRLALSAVCRAFYHLACDASFAVSGAQQANALATRLRRDRRAGSTFPVRKLSISWEDDAGKGRGRKLAALVREVPELQELEITGLHANHCIRVLEAAQQTSLRSIRASGCRCLIEGGAPSFPPLALHLHSLCLSVDSFGSIGFLALVVQSSLASLRSVRLGEVYGNVTRDLFAKVEGIARALGPVAPRLDEFQCRIVASPHDDLDQDIPAVFSDLLGMMKEVVVLDISGWDEGRIVPLTGLTKRFDVGLFETLRNFPKLRGLRLRFVGKVAAGDVVGYLERSMLAEFLATVVRLEDRWLAEERRKVEEKAAECGIRFRYKRESGAWSEFFLPWVGGSFERGS